MNEMLKTAMLQKLGVNESDITTYTQIPAPMGNWEGSIRHEVAKVEPLRNPPFMQAEWKPLELPFYQFGLHGRRIKVWAVLHGKTLFFATNL
jgi:hypothetical protein